MPTNECFGTDVTGTEGGNWAYASSSTSTSTWDFGSNDWIFSTSAAYVATANNWQPVTYITHVYAQPIQEELDKRDRERKEADERAIQLLLDNLNDAQRVMFEQASKILVQGQESGDQYEISLGRSRNIRVLDAEGKYKWTLCAHPGEYVPDCDTVLAQKLMLESAEKEFLRIANVS